MYTATSKKRRVIGYERKKSIAGFLFLIPWILGTIMFFIRPLFQSFIYSINKLKIETTGPDLSFIGLGNYKYALFSDPDYIKLLIGSVGTLFINVPLIIMFSLFIGFILNQNFRGRIIARAVFFLPVIITTGVIIDILKGDSTAQSLMTGSQVSSSLFQVTVLQNILAESGYSTGIIDFVTKMMNSIFEVSWKSGIQILLFMAGFQSIPASIYEASKIEGATTWETFWKITFPMMSPTIMLNVIYTLIDNFSDYSNPVIKHIYKLSRDLNIEYSATLSWVYFVIVFAVIGIFYAIINKRVFYIVE